MNKTYKIVLTSLFAALCCVATMVIRIPTIGTSGYVNVGDVVVLLSAWILGNFASKQTEGKVFTEGLIYAAAAAGIGSMMADVLAEYVLYAPGTFVIKALMAIVAAVIFKSIVKMNRVAAHILSAVAAEIVMVVGYFLYESTLLGYGIAAAGSIPSNMIQGGTCLVLAVILIEVLNLNRAFHSIFKTI